MNIITNVAGMVSNTIDPIIHGKGVRKNKNKNIESHIINADEF